MNDLRTAAQQALEALEEYQSKGAPFLACDGAVDALRAALAQQAEPDHETRAELAEQQVVQLAEERDHYRNLWQKAQQAELVEPVAWMCSSPELMAKGYKRFSSRCEGDWNIPVYTAPLQRKPLTEEEIESCRQQGYAHAGLGAPFDFGKAARAVERAHGIKGVSMTTQPDALRLAAEMDQYLYSAPAHPLCTDAAAELRRLHAECNDLAHQLNESNERNGRLKAQRDALLEVLLGVEKRCSHSGYVGKDGQFLKVIQAAIAKATGETA